MQLSISTSSVPGDLLTKLETIAAAGFDKVDFHESDLIDFSGTAKDIGKYLLDFGLTVNSFYPFDDFEGFDGAEREAAFARLKQKLNIMQDIGAETLLVGSTANKNTSTDRKRIIADFSELARHAEKAGCRAALMALPWAHHIREEAHAFEIIEEINSPYLGLALNSLFSLANGSQAARLRDLSGERIFHIQIADAPALHFDISQLQEQFRLLPGQGKLNLASFVRILSRAGYSGTWSIAQIGESFTERRETYAQDGYRSLVSLLDDVARSEPILSLPVKGLPEKIHTRGFEFIEFTVDGEAKDTLCTVLSEMSFRKERQHRTKSVELWRQGAINIVVNSETKGFAAEALNQKGPCVCDMGLRVHDADQTLQRAMKLGTPIFSQPTGSGELDIPAIKSVDGLVVHFIDEKSNLHRVWDIEFDPVPKTIAPQPAGLRRIDHIAQAMQYQEMQSWLTYYLSTFEMEKADIVDVMDPSGVILSQALTSPENEVRLNLNGVREQETFAGNFLANGAHTGIQHIAFYSDDIFETSEQLEATGFDRLPVAADYYEELKNRFGLTDGFVEALRSGNIFYDRDEKGEYFQIYSASFWGGFFFEIVERRGGYQGYGARNAPIRLAAQTHHMRNGGTI